MTNTPTVLLLISAAVHFAAAYKIRQQARTIRVTRAIVRMQLERRTGPMRYTVDNTRRRPT
jgi:hypothetical protein